MRKFNYEDWNIEPELETGNDDFVFGNYVDWDRFRQDEEENLLAYFDIQLPWGEELFLSEYFELLRQEVFQNTSIVEDCDLDKLEITTQSNIISEMVIQFPRRKDSKSDEIISAVFDYYGIPSGTEYEHELPEKLKYWHNMLENGYLESEYENYRKYPLKFGTYKKTISEIALKVSNTSDTLTKKALILSSFIISESLLKSAIVSKIPKETAISKFSKEILSKEIDNKLRGSVNKRNELFKQLFNEKAPKQEWINLRNSLAHDIESSTIQGNEISYISFIDHKEYTVNFDNLFKQQMDFYKKLQKIMKNDDE
ncbi:hypothetical protein [Pediococcus ethanolidurans]|uniref:hypothetical protein n=1 Tax=Pediococcus ethanolidurans TaxID=319653 RepID=UPI001C1EAF44|nr:hypothetical protein [Pediococcus ethanolidurans]MBU7555464.1 hypothetical protein [Pediococcus ethanolidurans]MBU7563818.1 hypothetical protein [Pediococcus ethanolidurans]MCT4397436.1 hypothetical protein [Pediococcus ethanolidurans]MCV3315230.1 hypothetical protein [Pediococcus ethanolidurans]MCV3327253.1 hypothetical protein [Pediococcus ethanolidurans]